MTAAGAGISASGPMWNDFMVKALATLPRDNFPEPNPVNSPKIMLNGNYVYTAPDGTQEIHEILKYVDRNDPSGPFPENPGRDPLFSNWEWPVSKIYGSAEQSPSPEPSPSPTP